MRDNESLTWEEIAKRLGSTSSAVAHTYSNAQEKLRAAERTLRELGRVGLSVQDLEREFEELKRRLRAYGR